MSNFVEVIKACEQAGGAGTKLAIQEALRSADPIARRLIREALNPYRVFGVRKYDMPQSGQAVAMEQLDYDTFFNTLDKLDSRELTGDAARTAVTFAIGLFPLSAHEYIARIFDKDLKAGFSADTFNNVVLADGLGISDLEVAMKTIKKMLKDGGISQFSNNPNYHQLIPTFEVMLADKCESTEDFDANVTFPCMGDFKYDGERTIAMVRKTTAGVQGYDITYFSRSGKEADHVKGLFDQELVAIHEKLGYDFILDGERFAGNFTETMNAKKSGNDEAKKNLRFRSFFLMPYTDWIAQSTKITMRQNREFLNTLLNELKLEKITLSEGREVKDYQDMMNYCNDVIDIHKQEGLILKNWDSVYTWDRTFAWTKVKRFYDCDCRIVGFYQGRPKSRLQNTLGGISVVGFLENGERVEVNVGSGFSDELRNEIWNNQDKWMGRTVVIKYQEVSKAKGKEVSSLRFPTYERDRDDKTVEI